MAKRHPKSQPTWTDVKTQLMSFDRPGLLSVIQDLYAAHRDNQTFLHTRFGLGEDILFNYSGPGGFWHAGRFLSPYRYERQQTQRND
jgi:hypothetical protein